MVGTRRINATFVSIKKKILMIGVDVYHSKKTYHEENKKFKRDKSLASFVAAFISVKNDNTEYIHYNNVVEKESGEEIIRKDFDKQDLGKFVKEALDHFQSRPDIIIVYRDGVAESQLFHVVQHEINQIVETLNQEEIKDVDVIYSVIQKRIHIRFVANDNDDLLFKNPPPGTVVNDGGITTSFFDEENVYSRTESFYLVPTLCDLSTVRPVQYIVIYNDKIKNTIPISDFQLFTYYISMMYPNWTDSVKLAYPTQLAHKEAYLIGEKCKIDAPVIHPYLKSTLFFI